MNNVIFNGSGAFPRSLRLLTWFLVCAASGSAQDIPPPPPSQAVVYFVRTSSYGFLINFSYFDSAKCIGIFSGQGYFRYPCEPGSHLFWARSENKDFVEAEVVAGRIYFLEASVLTGWGKARVELNPVDPNDAKRMKRILKLMKNQAPQVFSDAETDARTEDFGDVIGRGLLKYKEEKERGISIKKLDSAMYYDK